MPHRPLRYSRITPPLLVAMLLGAAAAAEGVYHAPELLQPPDIVQVQDTLRMQDTLPVSDTADLPVLDVQPPPDPVPPLRAELDEEIRSELQAIFGRVESLRRIRVGVEAGIVRLEGTVPVPGDRAQADTLARRMEGVILVDDRLEVDRSLQRRWAATWRQMREWGLDALGYLPLLLAALAIVAVASFLSGSVGRWLDAHPGRGTNPYMRSLLRRGLRLLIVAAGVLLALNLVGATWIFGALLGTAGIAGLAIGFAFKDIIENYLAGILLSIRHPFSPNDHVVLAGHEGKVVRLTAREMILMTLDGNHVRIPNAMVFGSVILNYSRNPLRRFTFEISVATTADPAHAQDLALEVLRGMANLLPDPPPRGVVAELRDSSVLLRFHGWVDQRQVELGPARGEAIRLVKAAFEGGEIAMPSSEHRVVWVGEAEPPLLPSAGAEPVVAKSTPPPAPERSAEPDRTLDLQIERDRAEGDEGDLLSSSAGKEKGAPPPVPTAPPGSGT